MLLIVLPITLIFIYGVRFYGHDGYNCDYLSLSNTMALKGICSLLIVLSHLSIKFPDKKILIPFNMIGYLTVGIFFFLSGYGLAYGASNKKGYFNGFLRKHLTKILAPYFIINIVYLSIRSIIHEQVEIYKLFISFFNGHPYVDYSWYVLTIIVFYIAFYCIFSNGNKNNNAFQHLIIFLLIYVLLLNIIGFGDWWHKSTLTFAVGIYWGYNSHKLEEYFRTKYYFKVLLILMLLCMMFFSYLLNIKEVTYIGSVLAAPLFVLLSAVILMKIKIGNPIILMIGEISYELYLLQGLAINTIFTEIIHIENSVLNAFLTLFVLIIISLMFHNIRCKFKSNYNTLR